ncbi:LOW QUALITY PROTEIN: guanine nucleotide exchange factor subunit Rich [Lepeophtheirus salmonis]|uniref:LOW QUALITY PROTEIN: guanine nucleotide exchange factor subunit Rich n=1 Tax=Lepeophtheirus salmonis TaxID=72036 RepID=UPI001AE2ECE2|nr:LOW QUALITY PROTEIN: guanine nucleotide exchange factor subunit Rich-like [Lepeophtheirus salmonis]
MYYPVGWPKVLQFPQLESGKLQQVICNLDKILCAILTSDSLLIWYIKPCVPIICHRRCENSLEELGNNVSVQWKPDSSMLIVSTSKSHLIVYELVVPTNTKTLYELVESSYPTFKRESDELFIKENIPPLIFSKAYEFEIEGGISDVVAIREELMIATCDGKILRYSWQGEEKRDFSLNLKRIPFCTDQQVIRAVPLADPGVFVKNIKYSPLLGGYAIVLNDGRAGFLASTDSKFDPNTVTGIWAMHLEDATTVALNHKYKLIAFGRKNSHGILYNIDEMTGGLSEVHKLILSTHDYPGFPGSVTTLRWTPDGTALAMVWSFGGFSIWSTFGAMIMCSLCWDYGIHVSDPVIQNPLCIKSLDWTAEGYQLWMINAEKRTERKSDPEFAPFPDKDRNGAKKESKLFAFANKALVINFAKSPMTVNPCMSKQQHIYLQAEDRIYINLGRISSVNVDEETVILSTIENGINLHPPLPKNDCNNHLALMSAGAKSWNTINIPHSYIGNSYPIRYTALDDECEYLAVAGRTGIAHYSLIQRKWRLFGNETQEKDFIVTGGLIWWKGNIIMGVYNFSLQQDEIRIYPKTEKLDNLYCRVEKIESQVILLNTYNDNLIVYTSDNSITLYTMKHSSPPAISSVTLTKRYEFDCRDIQGFTFHPACVILVALTNIRIETSRFSTNNRDSVPRETSVYPPSIPEAQQTSSLSIIMNVHGRVMMIKIEKDDTNEYHRKLSLPTVLVSNCETIWFPKDTNLEKPHLTASLWLYCGSHGMKVWLPVFPREGDEAHTFMSRRIMLHFPLNKFYPLAILFDDAIILGAENDTILLGNDTNSTISLPYSTLERTSLLFLHPILRQLIKRNLGFHAWEIARTCMMLPYFSHTLELLLHEVLEEEATSTEPIPDALLPSIVSFIQEFPVYHQTIGRCARKTEVALWPHLFSTVGSPRALFTECLNCGDLDTAATYLLILQNLEPPSVAQNHATLLLDAALDQTYFNLVKELVRFLKRIDPDDAGGPRQLSTTNPSYGPVSHKVEGPEDEISILLGTLQVPRTRSASVPIKTTSSPKEKISNNSINTSSHRPGDVTKNTNQNRTRKTSSGGSKDADKSSSLEYLSPDEFYIDVILQRHARKLLSNCRLFDLGTFAAQLDFHTVTWLKKEANRAARLDNYLQALKKIHADFNWPFPIFFPNSVMETENGINTTSSSSLVAPSQSEDEISSSSGLPQVQVDSGYQSRPPTENGREVGGGELGILSEKTINAMLRPHSGYREDLSIASEDVSSIAGGIEDNSVLEEWANKSESISKTVLSKNENFVQQDVEKKGSPRSEVQLRYLLQIMMEANCLEIASLISVVLKDYLALIRIVNAARSPPNDKTVVSRLYQNLKAIEAWAQSECHGYTPFFNRIQPQLNSLKAFLLQMPQVPNIPRQSSANSSLLKGGANKHLNLNRSLSMGDYPKDPGVKIDLSKYSPSKKSHYDATESNDIKEKGSSPSEEIVELPTVDEDGSCIIS